jgi:hypothetical protein
MLSPAPAPTAVRSVGAPVVGWLVALQTERQQRSAQQKHRRSAAGRSSLRDQVAHAVSPQQIKAARSRGANWERR